MDTDRHTPRQQAIGVASLVLIGALFGISGVIAKWLSEWIDPYQVVFWRFGFAVAGLVVVVAITRQWPSLRGARMSDLVGLAVCFPASVVLFTLAIFHGSVALAVFSFYTATLLTSFALGRVFFGERLSWSKWVALVCMLGAIVAFTDPIRHVTFSAALGLGLISGVLAGVCAVFQKHLSGSTNRTGMLGLQSLSGMVLAGVILAVTHHPVWVSLPIQTWVVVAAFGVALLAISYLFFVGFHWVNLNTGSVLVSSELIFGPLFAYVLLGEHLGGAVLVGGALVGIAAVTANLPDRERVGAAEATP